MRKKTVRHVKQLVGKKLIALMMLAGAIAISGAAHSETKAGHGDKAASAVKERIVPVGKTCLAGEPCAAAVAAAASGPKSGKDVYASACGTCHASGLMSAPKLGSSADWGPRVAKGLDKLYSNAIGGVNSMPPKGACAACSDDDIKAAVKYMVDGSK
jgi:cytochrome c5